MRRRTDDSWKLTYRGFIPEQEKLREALCTLGNGYMGTRGAACEAFAAEVYYPGTYIAGLYNRVPTNIAGRTIYNEDLVNCPNWLSLTFALDGEDWFCPATARLLSYVQELDMYRGILTRRFRVDAGRGRRLRVTEQRLVHMRDAHRAALRYEIIAENFSGSATVRALLDGRVRNQNVARYRQLRDQHWVHERSLTRGMTSALVMRTSRSRITLAVAGRVRWSAAARLTPAVSCRGMSDAQPAVCARVSLRRGRPWVAEKFVAVHTSRDEAGVHPLRRALADVRSCPRFGRLCAAHERAWADIWKHADLTITGDPFAQRVLRLHLFHLYQTASPHNQRIDAGFPARGLHGEAYRGHIFWDEMFCLPEFDRHMPEISRALLRYRYRRLPAARRAARQAGYRGAMFPWQSSARGDEQTQEMHLNPRSNTWGPDYSRRQRHVSLAIACNVWRHWMFTRDRNFLCDMGAELLLSIARFFAALAVYHPRERRFHISGVMGPDEFHERLPGSRTPGVTDNAYTNIMTVWTLGKARELLALLPAGRRAALTKKLRLRRDETALWQRLERQMSVEISAEGIISQFRGYFSLRELDWRAYRRRYGDIHRLDRILKAEGDSPDGYKVAKQADVLMLFYLLSEADVQGILHQLGYPRVAGLLRRNYEYYEPRTSHGSTLSKVVHCALADELGKRRPAWQMFQEVLRSDLYDTQGGTTPEGIHTGVMGGSLDIVYRYFAGICLDGDRVRIYPRLPRHWRRVSGRIYYRGMRLGFTIRRRDVTIQLSGSSRAALALDICGTPAVVTAARPVRVAYGRKTAAGASGRRMSSG